MAVEVELLDRIDELEHFYIRLLEHNHQMLADAVREEIEGLREQLEDYRYVERFGEYAWNGVSEKDFI